MGLETPSLPNLLPVFFLPAVNRWRDVGRTSSWIQMSPAWPWRCSGVAVGEKGGGGMKSDGGHMSSMEKGRPTQWGSAGHWCLVVLVGGMEPVLCTLLPSL